MRADFTHLSLERDADKIAWLSFDQRDSGANVLSQAMFADLEQALTDLEEEPPQGLALLSRKPSGFMAGADVGEFTRIENREQVLELIQRGQSAFRRIEALPFPTLALIHGFCLGGGLELALACDYRVVSADGKCRLGLPEVRLGIHPGYGGSARLIRLLGVLKAMPLMLSGRNLDARQALRLGLADESAPRRHLRRAARQRLLDRPKKRRRGLLLALLERPALRRLVARRLRKATARRARQDHYPAPFALIDLWESQGGNFDRLMAGEGPSIAELFLHPSSRNLVKVFSLQQRLKKSSKPSEDAAPRRVHVIGAGVMGGDIAAWCALKGLRVSLQDQQAQYIAPAIKRAAILFSRRLRDAHERQAAFDRLLPDPRGHGLDGADIVIEAIVENLEAKTNLYRQLEPRLKPEALLATNTSSIPLELLSAPLRDPSRLVGLHFFNPVAKMQLVELIAGRNGGGDWLERGTRFIHAIDRLPLPVKSAPGFLVNRVLMPYLLEAMELLKEGAAPEHVDEAALNFGMPMGPVLLADMVGLDVCLSVAQVLAEPLQLETPALLHEKVAQGRLGTKAKQGFYDYRKGRAVRRKNPPSAIKDEELIRDRLILRLLNECIACLREEIVQDEQLLDAGLIFGAGFPPFLGGPMSYLRARGADAACQRLEALADQFGPRFAPDAGWEKLLAEQQ